MNGESGTRADELQKFFASIDEFGGWPVGMKYCSLAHTSRREVKFGNEYLRTDLWTTIAKADDYYLWKLSDDAKDEIKRSVYKQLGQELLSRGGEMNIPEGWKLVPIEPTDVMLKEAKRPVTGPAGAVLRSQEEIFTAQYQLALVAAPTPPAQEESPYIKVFANTNGEPAGYDTNIEQGDVFEKLATYLYEEVNLEQDDETQWSSRSTVRVDLSYLHSLEDDLVQLDKLRKAAEEALDVLGKLGCEVTAGKIRAALEGK